MCYSSLRTAHTRQQRASCITEFAAGLAIVIPLMMLVLQILVQITQVYFVKSSLSQLAETAARTLAVHYIEDSKIATASRNVQDKLIFDRIRMNGILHASEQFERPEFMLKTASKSVKVSVAYLPGQHGLIPLLDPLNMLRGYQLRSSSTYPID